MKSLALSKLVFICSVMQTPKLFVDEVNNIVLDFIWGHKPPKIKYTTLIKTRQEGGLETEDFSLFNKALKLNWFKGLCSNSDAPWQYILKSLSEPFKCDYDIGHLNLSKCLPAFYHEIISFWARLNSFQPKKQK